MRRASRIVSTVVATVGLATIASADDINWQGLYLGASGTYVSAEAAYYLPFSPNLMPNQSLQGGLYGLQMGYNWQSGNAVLGLEMDFSIGQLSSVVDDGKLLSLDGEMPFVATIRGRLGYSFGSFMPYVTGGFLLGSLREGATCPLNVVDPASACSITGGFRISGQELMLGWTVGAGAEYALSANWSLKGEALYGHATTTEFSSPVTNVGMVTSSADLSIYMARLGINYRF